MDRSLIGTYICKTCEHNASVCTCFDPQQLSTEVTEQSGKPLKRIIPFVEYIENKYHSEQHVSHPKECYQKILK